jgi:hypothetical protein
MDRDPESVSFFVEKRSLRHSTVLRLFVIGHNNTLMCHNQRYQANQLGDMQSTTDNPAIEPKAPTE